MLQTRENLVVNEQIIPAQAETGDLGRAIRDGLGGRWVRLFKDIEGVHCDLGKVRQIENIDASDPSNLVITLNNGQRFIVRIIAA